MKSIVGLVLLAALQQQSCIEKFAGPPEQIAADAAREFRPYFPKVQAHADPQNQVILVMTCAQGLGLPFFQSIEPQLAAQLQNNPKLRDLRMAGLAEAFGQRIPYNSMVVIFEDRMLMWRRSDGAVLRLPINPEVTRMYREGCREGFTETPASPSGVSISKLNSEECISLQIAVDELREKSSERSTIRELTAMKGRYCK